MASNSRVLAAQGGWRAYAAGVGEPDSRFDALAQRAASMGFNTLLALGAGSSDPALADPAFAARLSALVASARGAGVMPWATIVLDRVTAEHPLAHISPRAFQPALDLSSAIVDPRKPIAPASDELRLRRGGEEALSAWWMRQLARLADLGIEGFVQIDASPAGHRLAEALKALNPDLAMRNLRSFGSQAGAGDDGVFVGAALARPTLCGDHLAEIALTTDAWALSEGAEGKLGAAVCSVNRLLLQDFERSSSPARDWTGPHAALSIKSRTTRSGALVAVHNRGETPAAWPAADLPPLPWRRFSPIRGFDLATPTIAPGQTALFEAIAYPPSPTLAHEPARQAADPARRVIISTVTPSVDGGAFPVRRVLGERLDVRADIFTDGHEKLAAAVVVRASDEEAWTRYPLRAEANDVWSATLRFDRLGRHDFAVEAWLDVWGGFVRDLAKKQAAGRDLTLEIREGRALIEAVLQRMSPSAPSDIVSAAEIIDGGDPDEAEAVLLSTSLAEAMALADSRPFLARSFSQPVQVEREAARFSSWYEIFPRSQTDDRARHGTLADVVARLPHIAAMGFDTLYFPPIHPIGTTNRKGRNNSLTPAVDDVGSPYAIGSADGGHTAVHPQLGTLEDFKALVVAAKAEGLEIALDFAIQCSPDHPWLREHPAWFAWRADGSLKYAENPPKTYEDIVNVDFYGPDAAPSLWEALRDVVLFWVDQGVRTFRVDNPHTKPFAFWRWMIAEVNARHPDVLFLSEAFTRPKTMYHLAKIGFSQSYSYFTWRHTKAEFEAYLTELTQTNVREYFRPNFFVNTPDINPYFLQTSGRGGFLIRAALAATLSGLFGVYAGFELCEAAALPGREEYLDSEKYEIRPRPDRAPGDIVDEISRLNRIRRDEPALQTHLGLSFHNAYNDQILYFSKAAPGRDDRILVAISLDPHQAQEADFEVPLWLLGLADDDGVEVEDLVSSRRFRWTGKMQHTRLTPSLPYAIWRISPAVGG
jgi:glycosidase